MNKYDEVPYPVLSHSQTHPSALATLAIIHGMKPAPVAHCRVLELGCAGGGNLIPMAYSLPESEFVGIDYSTRQIAEGRSLVDRLELKNIRLESLNLLDVDESLGQFDYIIAHGLYSWVPPNVRDRLFEVCKNHLSPNGIAYISYNAYPGWKTLSAVRDILLYHTRDTEDPMQRAVEARGLLEFLVEFMSAAKSVSTSVTYAHADFLKSIVDKLNQGEDSYILHDILEDTNDPVYFHEFIAQAQSHSLQFVCDADFRPALASNLPPNVSQTMMRLAKNRIEWEQYTDFLTSRMFRQTLLCHDGIPLGAALNADTLRALRIASSARPVAEADSQSTGVQKFSSSDGAKLATDHPLTQMAVMFLIEIWPRSATFDKLLSTARARLTSAAKDGESAALDAQTLASTLLKSYTYSAHLVELTVHTPEFVTEVSERPVASKWARIQAEHFSSVTNMRHERVQIDSFQSFLLRRLDGTNDQAALVEQLMNGPVAGGDLMMKQDDEAVSEPAEIRGRLIEEVDKNLRVLARMALLIA